MKTMALRISLLVFKTCLPLKVRYLLIPGAAFTPPRHSPSHQIFYGRPAHPDSRRGGCPARVRSRPACLQWILWNLAVELVYAAAVSFWLAQPRPCFDLYKFALQAVPRMAKLDQSRVGAPRRWAGNVGDSSRRFMTDCVKERIFMRFT